MRKEGKRWWVTQEGVKGSTGNGGFFEVLLWSARGSCKAIAAPIFCIAFGHTWRGRSFGGAVCALCGREY